MQYKILLLVLFLGLFGVWAQDDNNNSQESGSNEIGIGNNSGNDGDQSGGDHSSGDHGSGDHNSGDHGSGDHSGGDHGSGDHSSGDHSSGDHSTGGHSSGDHSSGEHSSGDHSSGDKSSRDHSSSSSSSEEENENFHYPCKNLDEKCVQDFFLSTFRGRFTPVHHKDGQPIYMVSMVAYMPKHNTKVKCNGVNVTFHGTKILKFYQNRRTRNIVITVKFDHIIINSPKTQVIRYRNGFEPVYAIDFTKITYQPMNITCVIPWRNKNQISMKDAVVSAFISNEYPKFELGHRISDSSNKAIQRTYEGFKNDPQTSTEELFLTKAYYCMHGYLQNYIAGYRYQYSGEMSQCH